jgi:hypothetical protein
MAATRRQAREPLKPISKNSEWKLLYQEQPLAGKGRRPLITQLRTGTGEVKELRMERKVVGES